MAFNPNKITKEDILSAVDKIEKENISLEPSSKFDVYINDKLYPPKEVMRYAHYISNGELMWEFSGGEPTNKYLTSLGFEIRSKSNAQITQPIGLMWKLGCRWGNETNKIFYNYIKEKKIVIGLQDGYIYGIGDLMLICDGQKVKSLAQVKDAPKKITENESLQSIEEFDVNYDDSIYYENVEWYELDKEDIFDYKLQKGICQVQQYEIRQKAKELWNSRNTNYWIFQGNPNAFDFKTAIKENLLEDWTVTAHKDKIKIGDKVILWVSGKESGCYALAEVTIEPRMLSNSKDAHLWKTEEKDSLKAGIKIVQSLIDNPLRVGKIKETEGLENLKVGNQGTNFSATKKEYKIIKDLISGLVDFKNQENMIAKNSILYGPPGTGKTYNSIDKSIEIASPENYIKGNHESNKKIFDELRSEGQIEFVTFHQNYSYEDFVVGITPDVTSGVLSFEKREGIFKQLADKAKQNWLLANNKIQTVIDFNSILNGFFEKLISEEVHEVIIPMKSEGYSFKITSVDIDGGRILFTKQSGGTGHDLLIKNLKAIYEGTINYGTLGLGVYYNPLVEQLKKYAEKIEPQKTVDEKQKSFVLVIDEINRANISKVFGELITLLEEDKRLGEDNEIKITLPNGEREFGIPPNLYIIGTMNTADKSIALIDIALRRRFEFMGFYPIYEEYGSYDSEAIELLKKINEAIFKEKKSADYLIGHAYFMKNQPIDIVLRNKIVPLLMEYFSSKTDIVSRIFVGTNWNVTYDTVNYNWSILKA